MHMETPRRKIKRRLFPSQRIEWHENPEPRRSTVKATRYGLDQLNIIAIDSSSDSDLDRNVLEILSPTRSCTNVAYVLRLFCLCSLPNAPLEHRVVPPSTKEREAYTKMFLFVPLKAREPLCLAPPMPLFSLK